MTDLVKDLADAEEMLQQCQDELENAQSVRNGPRIAQCKRWRAEARVHRDAAKQALNDAQGPTWLVKPTAAFAQSTCCHYQTSRTAIHQSVVETQGALHFGTHSVLQQSICLLSNNRH